MNIKKIISMALAVIMMLQTIVFANEEMIAVSHNYLEYTEDLSNEANSINANNENAAPNYAAEVQEVSEVVDETSLETTESETVEPLSENMGAATIDVPTKYTFAENVAEHHFSLNLSSSTVIKFNVSFLPRSGNESILIYYNDLIANGRSFELDEGTHEFSVKRSNSDMSSELEYKLEILKNYAYDKEQKSTGYSGIDVTTGIYNESFDDLVTVVAGNEFKIQRRYNSNEGSNILSQGWSINYECKAFFASNTHEIMDEDSGYVPIIETNFSIIKATIPDGNCFSFYKVDAWNESLSNKNEIYLPLNSCNSFDFVNVENRNHDYYVLTTTDGRKYFYTNINENTLEGGQLYRILDLHGNAINIYWDENKIDYITDIVGNRYEFNYSLNGRRLERIVFKEKNSDEVLLASTYAYTDDLLTESVDSSGKVFTYSYIEKNSIDDEHLLSSVKADDFTLSQISYQEIDGNNCVDEHTDKYGATHKYTYDRSNNSTTVVSTGENGLPRTTIYRYDADNDINYTTQEVGGKSLETSIEYYTQEYPYISDVDPYDHSQYQIARHFWENGQIEKITNHNGITTTYSFIETNDNFEKRNYNGLPLSKTVTNSRNHVFEREEYEYTFGTLLGEKKVYKEVDGDFIATKYIYDTYDLEDNNGQGAALLRTEEYPSKYSYENQKPQLTTQYTYDVDFQVKGLPITVSYSGLNDSDSDIWTYTYDEKGNLTEVLHPENTVNSTKDLYTYNKLGLVTRHESAEGIVTLYEYNNGLQEIKKTVIVDSNNRGCDEITRTVYDDYGMPVQVISPNEYNPADECENNLYKADVGVCYQYCENGLLESITDSMGNTFEYTYDCFGNKITEKLPNGSIYIYTYDELSNLTSKSFKESNCSEAILLEENDYYYNVEYSANDGRYGYINRKYYNDNSVFATRYFFDHDNRVIKIHQVKEEFWDEESFHVWKYDMAGNLVCEYRNTQNWNWTEDCYTYGKYDAQSNTFYNEKITLPNAESSFYDTSIDYEPKQYIYERTDLDKNGNITELKVGTSIDWEPLDDVIVIETNTYYADNLLESTEDANGVTSLYEYDNDRNLSKVTVVEAGKEPQIIEYENAHNGKPGTIRTHVYDDNGGTSYITVENSYDKNGNLIKQKSSTKTAEGLKTEYLTTEYEYNLNNLQTSVTSYEKGNKDATIITESVDYDFAGNVILQTDKNGNTTRFVYDAQGFLVYTIYPNDEIKLTTRDTQGRVVYEVEPVDYNGAATSDIATLETYKADLEKIPEMSHTHYTYVPFENHDLVVTATKYIYDPESKTSTSYVKQTDNYDYIGNLVSTTDANGNTFRYEYDSFGNCVKYIEPEAENEFTTFYEYDMLGRKIKEGNSDGDYYAYTYDKMGNILSSSVTDRHGNTQTISTYTYDDGGRILTQTDGNGHTTTLVYDDNNRLMKQYAHGGEGDETKTDYYSYDVLGNLTEHTTRNGDTIEYEYDVFNRLVKTISDDGEVEYTYDDNGNILTMTDSTGTTTYTYDSMGRILTKNHTEPETETETETKKVSYVYDIHENIPYGYVAEITTEPDGDSVTKWYDSEDKIVKVIDGNDITLYNYYKDGRLWKTTKPNGSVSTNTYDDEGNLVSLVTLDADGEILDSFTYVYDDNSIGHKNQVSKTETIGGSYKGTTSYEYDVKGQLTKVTNPDGSTNEYTYDDAGNRLSKTSSFGEDSTVINYTYDNQNRLIKADTDNMTTYYGYDNNGNQISEWTRTNVGFGGDVDIELKTFSSETDNLLTLYEYDVFDRLIKIEQGDDIIENAYTADGKKLSRTTNGVLTYYVYDGNVVIEEQDEDNDETARNVYGRNLITRETDVNKVVMGYNGHGDVVYQAGITYGHILKQYDYDEFGNLIDAGTFINARLPAPAGPGIDFDGHPIDNPYRYAGYEYIEEIGIYDLNARYYNPEIARFLSQDPYYNLGNRVIGLYEINVPDVWSIVQANNIYVYCGNNPIVFFDPTGYITEEEIEMFENGEMAPMAYTYLMDLTFKWYLADTQEDRDKFHALAEDFRATGYTTTNGLYPNVDKGILFMPTMISTEPTKEQHYFRNKLNLNFSWEEYTELQNNLPENMKWDDNVSADYHQNITTNNKPNRKYVSFDGHFELIYNDDNVLQTEQNNPLDMGTYNYANPSNWAEHLVMDVKPYGALWIKWGNVPEQEAEFYKKTERLGEDFVDYIKNNTFFNSFGCYN